MAALPGKILAVGLLSLMFGPLFAYVQLLPPEASTGPDGRLLLVYLSFLLHLLGLIGALRVRRALREGEVEWTSRLMAGAGLILLLGIILCWVLVPLLPIFFPGSH